MFLFGLKQYRIKGSNEEDNKKKRQLLYKKEKDDEANRSTLFRLFESFMESTPQLLLQMYILMKKYVGPVNDSTISPLSPPFGECISNCITTAEAGGNFRLTMGNTSTSEIPDFQSGAATGDTSTSSFECTNDLHLNHRLII